MQPITSLGDNWRMLKSDVDLDLLDDDDDDEELMFDPEDSEGMQFKTVEIKEQDRYLPIANIAR